MDTCSRQQAAVLVALFLVAFAALVHALGHEVIWELRLHLAFRLVGDKAVLKLLHDLEELFKSHEALWVDLELLEQIDCLLWVPIQTFIDRLQVTDVDELSLLLVEHIEDATVVLDLLLSVLAPDVEFVGTCGCRILLLNLLAVDIYVLSANSLLTLLHLLDALWVYSGFVQSINIVAVGRNFRRL